jgi:hypothetical protein
VQQNLFQYDRYTEHVWARQKRSELRSEKAAVLHVKRMIDWRNSAVEQRQKEYRDTMLSIQDSAAQVKSWTDELRKAQVGSTHEQKMNGVMNEHGNRRLFSEIPMKPFASVVSATSARVAWEMPLNAPYIDYFTVKREPHPRVTALSHYTHGVEVQVEHEYRSLKKGKGGEDHAQRGTVEITGLQPGCAYSFVVHSFTEHNGHSAESDASDAIELPIETLEVEREQRVEGGKNKRSVLAVVKETCREGVNTATEALSCLLDPALYPIDEVKQHLQSAGTRALLRIISDQLNLGRAGEPVRAAKATRVGSKSKASSAHAVGLTVSGAGGTRGNEADDTIGDLSHVRGWFNKGDWGDGGILSYVMRLMYSMSECFAYGSICIALLINADLFSTLPVIWMLLVALIRNPHPAPEEWTYQYKYSLTVLFFRVLFETNAFCMDVDTASTRTDLNHWRFSMQPVCPVDPADLYKPAVDWMYSTDAIVLLTVKHRSTSLLWAGAHPDRSTDRHSSTHSLCTRTPLSSLCKSRRLYLIPPCSLLLLPPFPKRK